MLQRLHLFLGPTQTRRLFLLLAFTGLANLILNAFVDELPWARDGQTALVLVFLIGTTGLIVARLSPQERARWIAILAPAIGALIIGVVVAPDQLLVALGLALGWIVAGMFLFRSRGPMEYREAVKHLHKGRYDEAIQILDRLIKQEPEKADHYHFRAEVFRVWGKLDRSRRDYQHLTQLVPESAVAFNGLAEVELQAARYDPARDAAIRALERAPDDWVAHYNLGMIEDRLGASEAAIDHLDRALELRISDARHLLLAWLFLVRAYARLGDFEAARSGVARLRKLRGGLNEWQVLLQNDQAETLRAMLEEDVQTAQALVDGDLEVEAFANG